MRRERLVPTLILYAVIAMGLAACVGPVGYSTLKPSNRYPVPGAYTVEDRLEQFGVEATRRLTPSFHAAGLPFPPEYAAFLAFKDQRLLEVFARTEHTGWRFIRSYAILGASGHLGPKLREGDRQVPEGVYRVTFLNPNSIAHVSLRLDYPNAFDQAMAALDGRDTLGGDIMIHGGRHSIGCLAMGDEAAEDLFTLAALTRIENLMVVISPTDFRRPGRGTRTTGLSPWTAELYDSLRAELVQFGRDVRVPLYVDSDVAPFRMPAVSTEGSRPQQ